MRKLKLVKAETLVSETKGVYNGATVTLWTLCLELLSLSLLCKERIWDFIPSDWVLTFYAQLPLLSTYLYNAHHYTLLDKRLSPTNFKLS